MKIVGHSWRTYWKRGNDFLSKKLFAEIKVNINSSLFYASAAHLILFRTFTMLIISLTFKFVYFQCFQNLHTYSVPYKDSLRLIYFNLFEKSLGISHSSSHQSLTDARGFHLQSMFRKFIIFISAHKFTLFSFRSSNNFKWEVGKGTRGIYQG